MDSCSRIKKILEETEFLPPHNWLISYLECYDTDGWEGCEKWSNKSLILTDEELKKDIYLRDMQFIWGAFSAIPKKYGLDDINLYSLPELENPYYMGNHIVPQHPLALLEISVWDGGYTYISAQSEDILKPFYNLPYHVIDLEMDNKIMNNELCKIQDVLRNMFPNVSDDVANEVQWKCWHSLFRDKKSEVPYDKLVREVKKTYKNVSAFKWAFHYTPPIWNPYDQK